MSNFALNVNSSPQAIIQSLNYALATASASSYGNTVQVNGNVLVANTATGVISSIYSNGVSQIGTISYLYGYADVKYANSATGASGFSSNCTDATYYGVYNTTSPTESSNPTDYQWRQVSGGFGTTNALFYTTGGGGTINFYVGTSAPTVNYSPVIDNVPILLASLANSIVTTTSILPGAIVGNTIAANTVTGTNIQSSTITGTNIQSSTITGNLIAADTITGNLIQANTIQGNSIVAGSITATQLAANVLTVGNIISFNSNIEVNSGSGYWLDYVTGNTYFGGNTTIGNNLVVNGLVTAGALNANTVNTTTLAYSSVSTGIGASSSTTQTYTVVSGTIWYEYSYTDVSFTPTFSNESVYVNGNFIATFGIPANTPSGSYGFGTILTRTPADPYEGTLVSTTYTLNVTKSTSIQYFTIAANFTYYDTLPSEGTTYVYGMSFAPGDVTEGSFSFNSGTLVLQALKR